MILRNHGVVACGENIEEACYNLFNIMVACEIQMKALACGLDNLIIPSAETQRKLAEMTLAQNESLTLLENKKWKIGELEFEALMRCLDNAVRNSFQIKQIQTPYSLNWFYFLIKRVTEPDICTDSLLCEVSIEMLLRKLKFHRQLPLIAMISNTYGNI